jgi:hypothetical protein
VTASFSVTQLLLTSPAVQHPSLFATAMPGCFAAEPPFYCMQQTCTNNCVVFLQEVKLQTTFSNQCRHVKKPVLVDNGANFLQSLNRYKLQDYTEQDDDRVYHTIATVGLNFVPLSAFLPVPPPASKLLHRGHCFGVLAA